MNTKRNIKSPNLLKLGIIASIYFLLITFLILFAADAQFLILDRLFSKQSQLQINIQPEGSQVFVDGELKGETPLGLDMSGKRSLRVEHDGYLPFETEVDVRDEKIIIEEKLALIPFILDIDIPVNGYAFLENNQLVFGKLDGIYNWNYLDDEVKSQFSMSLIPANISFSPQGDSFINRTYNFIYTMLDFYSIEDGQKRLISNNIEDFAWGPKPAQYSVIESKFGKTEIRVYSGYELQSNIQIDQFDLIDNFYWSPTGSKFIIEEIDKITIYTHEDGKAVKDTSIQPAYFSIFSPIDDNKISYIDDSLNLILVDLETGEQEVVGEGVLAPYQWRPDGLAIIYTTYNTTEGETAFWQIDLQSGNKTLLADPSVVWGKVVDFQISPDQKMIAYLTDTDRLMVLILEE